jgi:N-acyl-D-aspartate/D-glutamate deacylase
LNRTDPAAIGVGAPRLVRDLPAGGRRFLQIGTGYLGTWVAGEAVRRDADITGARPGRLVRMGASAR